MASEMLYPIMPIYLKSIGFSIVLIGILEGVAEATTGISKGYFGKLSDSSGKRAPFVRIGYILSAISKPMMVVSVYPLWIFFTRTIDRFGKGIRTGARDAMLSDEASQQTKGKFFGFHRSMDTFGAVLGPSLALLYLWFYPEDYKTLFIIAFVPGFIAVLATFFVKDKKEISQTKKTKEGFFSFIKYWKESPAIYRKVATGLLVFTLFNSSDVFLLLKAKQSGLGDAMVIGVYIFYNLIYALAAFPVGIIADKVGLKTILVCGLFLFSIVYAGMAASSSIFFYLILFFLYGLYAAATEGISKALISNITGKKDTATAIGTFSGFQSICTMFASAATGFVWYRLGAASAFIISAIGAALVAFYFLLNVRVKRENFQTK